MSDTKTDPEAEYFARIDLENKRKLAEQLHADKAAEEKRALRELHYNRCGRCGTEMSPKLFRGVTIDLCPACGAVLLDPGELEQLAGEDQSSVFSGLASFFAGGKRS